MASALINNISTCTAEKCEWYSGTDDIIKNI